MCVYVCVCELMVICTNKVKVCSTKLSIVSVNNLIIFKEIFEIVYFFSRYYIFVFLILDLQTELSRILIFYHRKQKHLFSPWMNVYEFSLKGYVHLNIHSNSGWLVSCILWHINPCKLFNAKFCSYVYIEYI